MKLKRILAILALILIAALYLSTLVFALIRHPMTEPLLMAALLCTIVLPVLIYVFLNMAGHFKKQDPSDQK